MALEATKEQSQSEELQETTRQVSEKREKRLQKKQKCPVG